MNGYPTPDGACAGPAWRAGLYALQQTGVHRPERGLAPLTPAAPACAEAYAKTPALFGCERLVSSPYTRALETSAIFSRAMGLPIVLDAALHEWMADKKFRVGTSAESEGGGTSAAYCRPHLISDDKAYLFLVESY